MASSAQVHAVHAPLNDLVHRFVDRRRRRLLVAAPQGRVPLRDAAGGDDEEMAGAAGGVADGDFQEVLGIPGLPVLLGDRVERDLEQLIDERRGRVVRASGLALVAAQILQPEAGFGSINLGFEFEQRLVDSSQFFRVEMLVVDAVDAPLLVPERGEEADGRQEAFVGGFAAAQEVGSETFSAQRVSGAEEQAGEGGEGELGLAVVGAAGVQDDDELPPQVLVTITSAAGPDAAEACDREMFGVGQVPKCK